MHLPAEARGVRISVGQPTKRSSPKLLVEGALPWSLRSFLTNLPGVKERSGVVWVPKEPRLLELLIQETPPPVQLSPAVQHWYNKLLAYERKRVALAVLEEVSVPGSDPRLEPFQRVGTNFILHHKRCILADDVGLGKTAQTLEAIELSKWRHRVLVVCTNSSKWWWREEIEKWFPGQFRVVVEAATRMRDLREYGDREGFLIVNWELVRLMPKLKHQAWHWIVADEAHRLKNRKTQLWAHFRELVTRRLVMLTGTPIANQPADLWALLNLLYPDRYPSYWRFYEMYVNYKVDWHGYKKLNRKDSVRRPDLLRREIAPVLLRRDKDRYRHTLPPQYKVIPTPLTAVQARMYRTMAREMYITLEDGSELETFDVGAQLVRLRQIVSTTATLQESDHSSKLDAVVDLVEDGPGEQFVVFSLFRATVFALQRRLKKAGVSCEIIIGGQPPADRYDTVKRFQAGEVRVVVSTVQAGGESLTLTASHQVVFIEKHYSYVVQAQAVGRVDRFGQTEQCLITSLFCPGTVDELVERIIESKIKMVDTILQQAFFEHLRKFLQEG